MKRIALVVVTLLTLILVSRNRQSSITPITSYKFVDFSMIQPGTLVIFDVDETLIQPIDAYVANEDEPYAQQFRQKLMIAHPEVDNWLELASIVLVQAERPLIEPAIIQTINALKKRGIPVIACTAMNTGPYGIVPTLEEWRYNHLKSLGFEGSFENTVIKFEGLGHHPVFYKGILAVDLAPKGPVIGALLDLLALHPHTIIMFDDSLEYLLTVQQECNKRNLNFKGYEYKAAVEKPWNETICQLQADYLLRYKTWRNDHEAHILMNSSFEKAQQPLELTVQ